MSDQYRCRWTLDKIYQFNLALSGPRPLKRHEACCQKVIIDRVGVEHVLSKVDDGVEP